MENEKRLIDANALMEKEKYFFHRPIAGFTHREWFIREQDVAFAPTVDAVEVVRCKDCKHYVDELDCDGKCTGRKRCEHPKLDYEGFCDDFWLAPNPDDFCSYGEKKENDNKE